MTKTFYNFNTHNIELIDCPKYKIKLCVEQADYYISSDIPRYEIIYEKYGSTSIRSHTIDLINLAMASIESLPISEDVYAAVIYNYGDILKKQYNKYAQSKGWEKINMEWWRQYDY